METDLIQFNVNKRNTLSPPRASHNTERDTETDNEQNTIATEIHKDLTIKKTKVKRPNLQANIGLNAILEPRKSIFKDNSGNINNRI